MVFGCSLKDVHLILLAHLIFHSWLPARQRMSIFSLKLLKYAHHSWAMVFSIFISVSFTANGTSPTADHGSVSGFFSALCLATNTLYISWLSVHFMLRQLSPFYLQPKLLQTPESSACIQDSSTWVSSWHLKLNILIFNTVNTWLPSKTCFCFFLHYLSGWTLTF